MDVLIYGFLLGAAITAMVQYLYYSGIISEEREEKTILLNENHALKKGIAKDKEVQSLKLENQALCNINHELENQLAVDHLTGLSKRSVLEQGLVSYLSQLPSNLGDQRKNQMVKGLSVLFLDLDDFKSVNDTYGHQAGDKVLRAVSHRIQSLLREGDLVGRYGGEEIVVVLPNISREDSISIANSIREEVNLGYVYVKTDNGLKVSVSVGLVHTKFRQGSELMMEKADQAMYLAKENGKNRVETIALD